MTLEEIAETYISYFRTVDETQWKMSIVNLIRPVNCLLRPSL